MSEKTSGPQEAAAMPDVAAPFEAQRFDSFTLWVSRASSWLTRHPEHNNTEHGDVKGWRGHHFAAMCFDSKGRPCRMGLDFQRARDEGAFPVWWIWPDQIVPLIQRLSAELEAKEKSADHWLRESQRLLKAGTEAVEKLEASEARVAELETALEKARNEAPQPLLYPNAEWCEAYSRWHAKHGPVAALRAARKAKGGSR